MDEIEGAADSSQSTIPTSQDLPEISAEEFREGFGEDLRQTLDLNTWFTGEDLDVVYSRIEAEVREAVATGRGSTEDYPRSNFPSTGRPP